MKNDDKVRDMIRAILPSTARRAARERKRMENRRVRRAVRAALRCGDLGADLHRGAQHGGTVQLRRAADKLGPFLRWCRSRTRGMNGRQSLEAVRVLLPRTTIGDHAYSHWELEVRYGGHVSFREAQRRVAQSLYDSTRHRLRQALSVDPALQGRLNAAIKAVMTMEPVGPRRLLLGIHDVDAFVDAVLFRGYAREKKVLLGLLAEAGQDRLAA